jgi:hypothetical protein
MMKSKKESYRKYLLASVRDWIATGKRIAIFGTGEHTDYLFRCLPELNDASIAGYLDSDQGRQGNGYRGRVIHPIAWAKSNVDIIVCSSFVNERVMAKAARHSGCKVFLSHPGGDALSESACGKSHSWIAKKISFGANTADESGASEKDRGSYDIFIFPVIDWDYRFQRPQQLAKRIAAAGHRVFYLRNRFSGSRTMRLRRILPNLWTVELPGPGDFNLYRDPMKPLIVESIVENISLLKSRWNLREAICFVHFPSWTRPAFELRKRFGWKTVYDCMDDHAGFANVSRQCIEDEKELIRNGDLVLASSHVLHKQMRAWNKRCVLLPNAGEFDHFSHREPKAPRILHSVAHPILGYYGAISQWFDGRLIGAIARRRPEWNFVLTGNTHGAQLGSLKEHPNVFFLPECDYAGLPEVLHAFDVCLIPFKKSRLTDATNPVKIYEYCAAGKPIVASNLKELSWYRKYVSVATSVQSWMEAIEKALRRIKPADVRMRRLFARRNDWDARTHTFLREIEKMQSRGNGKIQ